MIACISPRHNALDRFLTERSTYSERLNDLIAFIQDNQHPLLSFYDTRVPNRFGGLDADFENAAHIGMANADRLLDYLLSQVFTPSVDLRFGSNMEHTLVQRGELKIQNY